MVSRAILNGWPLVAPSKKDYGKNVVDIAKGATVALIADSTRSQRCASAARRAARARQASADDLSTMGVGVTVMPPPEPGAAPVEGFDWRIPSDPAILRQAQDDREPDRQASRHGAAGDISGGAS